MFVGPTSKSLEGGQSSLSEVLRARLKCILWWYRVPMNRLSMEMGHRDEWISNRVQWNRAKLTAEEMGQIMEAIGLDSLLLLRPFLGGSIGEGALRFIWENPDNVSLSTLRKYYSPVYRKVTTIFVYQGLVTRSPGGIYNITDSGKMALYVVDMERSQIAMAQSGYQLLSRL